MSHYKQYPSYKNSEDSWLQRVPTEWSISPLKYRLRPLNEKSAERSNMVSLENVEGWTGMHLPSDSEYEGEGIAFEAGDILFGKLRPYLAKVLRAGKRGQAIGDFYVLRPTASVSSKFAQYWLLSSKAIDKLNGTTLGAKMPRVSWDDMGALALTWPSLEEQNFITKHLDRETTRIDALITKKTRFIELLREKRQALITHAVTKGLDPNVKMKDSGVEWLGEVPEHWGVRPIKSIVATPITDGPHETPTFYDEGVPFASAEAVSGGFLNFDKIRGFISQEDHERYSRKYKPSRNDIFMIKSGATTGVVAIVDTDKEFNIWSPLAVIRCGEGMEPYFVLNYMRSRSFQEAVALNWSFGTQQNIGMGVIGNLHITVPPKAEQSRIAEYLRQATIKIDGLVAKSERSIELLKERRSALITAAVTGQIDLREAA